MDQNNNETMQNTQPIQEPPINQTQQIQPQYIAIKSDTIPEEYKPISMWGYFGYSILFVIPLVGIILLLVFSFGGTRNVNLRNYARSYFCWIIISVVLFLLMFLLI